MDLFDCSWFWNLKNFTFRFSCVWLTHSSLWHIAICLVHSFDSVHKKYTRKYARNSLETKTFIFPSAVSALFSSSHFFFFSLSSYWKAIKEAICVDSRYLENIFISFTSTFRLTLESLSDTWKFRSLSPHIEHFCEESCRAKLMTRMSCGVGGRESDWRKEKALAHLMIHKTNSRILDFICQTHMENRRICWLSDSSRTDISAAAVHFSSYKWVQVQMTSRSDFSVRCENGNNKKKVHYTKSYAILCYW